MPAGTAGLRQCLAHHRRTIAHSCVKSDTLHTGMEPSGQPFNAIVCLPNKKPHNCCVNAGAIMTAAIVVRVSRVLVCNDDMAPMDESLSGAALTSARGAQQHAAGEISNQHGNLRFAKTQPLAPQAAGHPDKSVPEMVQHLMDIWSGLCGEIGEVTQCLLCARAVV